MGGAASAEEPALRLFVLGDAGERTRVLDTTVAALRRGLDRAPEAGERAILYLGDNFYPYGLNGSAEDDLRLEREVLVDSGLRELNLRLGRPRVHAVAGNHEYYRYLLFGKFPIGYRKDGSAEAADLVDWTYHRGAPRAVSFEIPGQADQVALVFVDSGLALAGGTAARDELEADLARTLASTDRPQVKWRLLAMHHPLRSRGDHGFAWDSSEGHSWLRRHSFVHKQDLCSRSYQDLGRRLEAAVRRAGVGFDAVLSGHDHSLQLSFDDRPGALARLQVLSGAAAKITEVRALGPGEFAAHVGEPPKDESSGGLAELTFTSSELRVRFLGKDPSGLCMLGAGGRRFRSFVVPRSGALETREECLAAPPSE